MSQPIVLLAGKSYSTPIVYNSLRSQFPIAAVIQEDAVPRWEFLRRRAKRLGLLTVAGQSLFRGMVVPYLQAKSKERIARILSENGLSKAPLAPAIVRSVPSVNSPESLKLLRELQPAVVVVNGTRIIAPEVLQSVAAPFLNLHAGITPKYRGVHGAYWALANDDREHCGVTVHLVDAGIDTGTIIAQARVEPAADDNFATYGYLQLAAGLPLLHEAVRQALAGQLMPESRSGESRLWSHPTLRQYLANRAKGVK